jgi:hypothetical protein
MHVNKVDKKLNLVIPIYPDADMANDKPSAYVHSVPIDYETFRKYWEVLGLTFSRIFNGGLGTTAGARVAHLMLEKVAIEQKIWDGPDGVKAGLIPTIEQRTNVVCVGKRGWESMTLIDAQATGVISTEDADSIEAAIIFFAVVSSMQGKARLSAIMTVASIVWGVQIESLSCTEFVSSLRTATAKESSGGTVVALSPTSLTG